MARKETVYKIETALKSDGRWIAEIPSLPGVVAYGSTEEEAVASAQSLALRAVVRVASQQKAQAPKN
jgi:predicted RNase H-like HicB family nuclease